MDSVNPTVVLQHLNASAWLDALLVLGGAAALIVFMQTLLRRVADKLSGRARLYVLASVPLLRLLIIVLAIITVVPILVDPTFENLVAIFGALALALGFAFKDYTTSLIAGIVTLYEMPYRPGDWIEVDGRYGEVKSIGMRAVEIVTADDSVVLIPHGKLWDSLISNVNDGSQTLLCVAEFYLHPQHDARQVREALRQVALTSPYVRLHKPVTVIVSEQAWGTRYRVKAYPADARDQFQFMTDLTVRGKARLEAMGARFATTRMSV
ncbi:mechanosensitive ion channel [Marinobacteraceae bacterium S3BR75-40.1]